MPRDEHGVALEILPLPDLLTKISRDLRANAGIDKDLVAILETHLIKAERHDKAGMAAATAIEQLAEKRVEADHV